MLLTLLVVQVAASVAATPADIEINANVRARSLTIEKKGEASLTIQTHPLGEELVNIDAPSANGRRALRNLKVSVQAEAHIADPAKTEVTLETRQPE